MLGRVGAAVLTVACALFVMALPALGQGSQGSAAQSAPTANPPANPDKDNHDDVDFGSRESDARARLILKAEKKAYEEHVSRAKEASDLASELKVSYAAANVFECRRPKKIRTT
jgi:hypothetical protein